MGEIARSSPSCGLCVFFFQAEDGIRDYKVTGVQTCALPIFRRLVPADDGIRGRRAAHPEAGEARDGRRQGGAARPAAEVVGARVASAHSGLARDRKSTRLNSSHLVISYAVFCLKKKKKKIVR